MLPNRPPTPAHPPTVRRARPHPAERARMAAAVVATGATVAMIGAMAITRHPSAASAGTTVSSTDSRTGAVGSGDAGQFSTNDFGSAATPAFPSRVPHTGSHGS